jgi:hypothetical protein
MVCFVFLLWLKIFFREISGLFNDLTDLDNLYESFRQIQSVSDWKEETQRYDMNLVPNLIRLKKSLINQTYRPTMPRGFMYYERGKPRYIESRTVDDRIVQRVVHNHEIMPKIQPLLIYDNASSLEHRGTSFFRDRLEYHLSDFAAHYGTDGYILLIDFKKFFDNIWHSVFLEMLRPLIQDQKSMALIELLVLSNAIDVSYMTDEEYANCMYVPFNNIEYRQKVLNGEIKCTGEKFMYKSMGIGSQISQDAGVFVPHRIDNFIKIVCGIRGYGRYMDDSYVLHHSKEYLWWLVDQLKNLCAQYGIFLNEKKTQIVSLKHEFTILQTRYKLHDNSSITIIPCNDTFIREARKLNKQAELLDDPYSRITYGDIDEGYKSWKGNIIANCDGKIVEPLNRMDDRYNKLFIDPFIGGK